MPIAEDKARITIIVTKKEKEQVEKLAERVGIPMGSMAYNLFRIGLDDGLLMNKMGLIRAVKFFRKNRDQVTAWLREEKKEMCRPST